MSWIRDHFYEFVFPAMVAAEGDVRNIGKPFDVKPADCAPKDMPSVLRKLWTLCQDYNVPWTWDTREINQYGGNSKYRERAKLHQKVLRATLDSAVVALKNEHCPRLFLGGRDVWTFAILCERRRIPYMFVPELSRTVASDPVVKPFLEERGFEGNELFLDTGFAGSIPRNLQHHFEKEFKFRLMSQGEQTVSYLSMVDCVPGKGPMRKVVRKYKHPNQLFPNRAKAREEALETEYLAKYWKTGTVLADVEQMDRLEFLNSFHVLRSNKNLQKATLTEGTFLYDGETFVKVPDGYSQPGPVAVWWDKLPHVPVGVRPKKRVAQFFSSRPMIQRAALLTAQLWYGIPYWRQIDVEKLKQEQAAKKAQWKKMPSDWTLASMGSTITDNVNSFTFACNSTGCSTTGDTDIWLDTESSHLTYTLGDAVATKQAMIDYVGLSDTIKSMYLSKKQW